MRLPVSLEDPWRTLETIADFGNLSGLKRPLGPLCHYWAKETSGHESLMIVTYSSASIEPLKRAKETPNGP